MAVRQSHWSCNGSTSQLPYCTTKSITTPALLPTPSFRHREPAAASRTFTLLVLANTHVDDRRLSLVTSIAGVKNSLGRKLEGQISPALLIKLTHQSKLSKFLVISPTLRLNVVFPPCCLDRWRIFAKELMILLAYVTRKAAWEIKSRRRTIDSCSRRLVHIVGSLIRELIKCENSRNVLITDVGSLLQLSPKYLKHVFLRD